MHNNPFNPLLLIPIFPIFFVTLWCAIAFLISRVSGWAALARRFRSDFPFTGPTWKFQSATMRAGSNYRSSLTVGSDPTGLYLKIFLLLKTGHPPLLIPWHEVSLQGQRKILFLSYVDLALGREEQILFRISSRLADRIQAAAGAAWPAEPAPQTGFR